MPRPIDIVLDVDANGEVDRRRWLWIEEQLLLYGPGRVRIQVSRPHRTSRANAYYWVGVIEPIRLALLEAGRPTRADVLHEHFKMRYLPPRVKVVFGIERVLPPSTAALDQTSFHDYIEAIKTDEDVRALGVWFEEVPGSLKSFSIEEIS